MNDTPLNRAVEIAHDMSIWGLFMQADWVVKLVIIGLIMASVWCWAVAISKRSRLAQLRGMADSFEKLFWASNNIEDLHSRMGQRAQDPMSAVFMAAMTEWQRAHKKAVLQNAQAKQNLLQRIDSIMRLTLGREMVKLQQGIPSLATISSAGPFIGLFGTVWGIMNSFTSIAASKNTSLAVVAPGIAEALFATAIGLLAAIPAAMFYNKFANDLSVYEDRVETFIGEFGTVLSRILDEREVSKDGAVTVIARS